MYGLSLRGRSAIPPLSGDCPWYRWRQNATDHRVREQRLVGHRKRKVNDEKQDKTTERYLSFGTEDARAAELCVSSPQTLSPSYRLAYNDIDFLLSDELRPVRLQLELLKTEIALREHKIEDTIIIIGSARIPEPDVAEKNLEEIEKSVRKRPIK